MGLWLELSDIAPRIGYTGADPKALATITSAMIGAQNWMESKLNTSLSPKDSVDVFDLDRSQDYNGMFALKCNQKFIKNIVITNYPTIEAYLENLGGNVLTIPDTLINNDFGLVLVPYTTKGILKVAYSSGFSSIADIPKDITEAVLMYMPSVMKVAQTANTDTQDYLAVLQTASKHSLGLVSKYITSKHPKINLPIIGNRW